MLRKPQREQAKETTAMRATGLRQAALAAVIAAGTALPQPAVAQADAGAPDKAKLEKM
jgi:hypothetical protein